MVEGLEFNRSNGEMNARPVAHPDNALGLGLELVGHVFAHKVDGVIEGLNREGLGRKGGHLRLVRVVLINAHSHENVKGCRL